MTPKRTLTLHPYQAEMLERLKEWRDTLLASPTGSGKTTIAAVAAYLSFAKGTTHAITGIPLASRTPVPEWAFRTP
jgi:superfamily II DNA or RNA helicase